MEHAPPTFDDLARLVREHEVGRHTLLETPFGERLIAYADLTATGRYLGFIEAWVRRLRPFYANTHTAISSTGRIMTELREDARAVIRQAVNASEDDLVMFAGAGATAAINKLVGLLGLRIDRPLKARLLALDPDAIRPLVLLGPFEHHSNQLPWLESWAEVDEVALGPDGLPDLSDLVDKLVAAGDRPLVIGAFSAASNVTGILVDVHAIARILHAHGALAVFDFAAAGPYVPIDMHPADDPEGALDALYISTHKFIGGPQASGVLVAHRRLFRCDVPERPGGGTVDYVGAVTHARVDYSHHLTEREEGGTPAIVGDVRAGIAFLVKAMLGPMAILAHERALARAAVTRLARHPRVALLGPTAPDRLAILSFNIEGLHHDLVSVLLDHLFGIQNRAGCSCAGPYGHRLLGIDEPTSERFRAQIRLGRNGIKPGWVRLTLPLYASPSDVEFMLAAVELVADLGEHFVPCYRLGWRDGSWRHVTRPAPCVPPMALTVEALTAASAHAGDDEAPHRDTPRDEHALATERRRYLDAARTAAHELMDAERRAPSDWNPPTGDPSLDALIWFRFVVAEPL